MKPDWTSLLRRPKKTHNNLNIRKKQGRHAIWNCNFQLWKLELQETGKSSVVGKVDGAVDFKVPEDDLIDGPLEEPSTLTEDNMKYMQRVIVAGKSLIFFNGTVARWLTIPKTMNIWPTSGSILLLGPFERIYIFSSNHRITPSPVCMVDFDWRCKKMEKWQTAMNLLLMTDTLHQGSATDRELISGGCIDFRSYADPAQHPRICAKHRHAC